MPGKDETSGSGGWHETAEDEDLPLIGVKYGFKDWKLIYDDPKNADFKKQRPNPHVLYKGDKLWIPPIKPKEFEVETNANHRFVLYPPRIPVEVVLQDDDGNPYSNVRYEIWSNGVRFGKGEQRTREDGLVFQMIPVAKQAELRVWFPVAPEEDEEEESDEEEIDKSEPEVKDEDRWWVPEKESILEGLKEDPKKYETIILQLGHMDPVETIEGVRDRLINLGYSCGDEKGDAGPLTTAALQEFQSDYGLPESGTVDLKKGLKDPTLAELKQASEGGEEEEKSGSTKK